MSRDINSIIAETAKSAASEVVRQQRKARSVNLYSVTERLLRAYPKLKYTVEHPDDYGFVPPTKSKSVTIAPPVGSGMMDKAEIIISGIEERKSAYERTCAQFGEIDAAVKPLSGRSEFQVIRMYYWNEDCEGNQRPSSAKPYTFEEIANELSAHGIEKSVKTLRKARTRLVQEMTVLLFGVDGALSVECREAPLKIESCDE